MRRQFLGLRDESVGCYDSLQCLEMRAKAFYCFGLKLPLTVLKETYVVVFVRVTEVITGAAGKLDALLAGEKASS